MSTIEIRAADFDDARVVALLRTHATKARAETGRGSAHALDAEGLRVPAISVWTAWRGEALLGVGALKRLDAQSGEIKSMHTAAAARRTGVAHRMLAHLVETARAGGLQRLYLETGAWPYFAAARAFYAAHGFVVCAPFGDYREDPNSVFMTRPLY